jgi:cardiolipin synthase
VDVRILVPDKNDTLLVDLSMYTYFDDVYSVGGRIFRYEDGFIHEKVMLVDDAVATVGTANFDNRSFRLNFEITGIVVDPAFAGEMERMFEADFRKSREMTNEDINGRSFAQRFVSQLAGLMAPVQ